MDALGDVWLRAHVALAADVERTLRLGPGDQPVLHEERELVLLHASNSDECALKSASAALSAFVDERNDAGHHI